MRRTSNIVAGLAAAAVCGLMIWISLDAGKFTLIYNLSFLGVMVLIILLSYIFGFHRIHQTIEGLDNASLKLIAVYKNRAEMADITRAGARIFEVEYLDRKYQEYLGYLRKTNSPCDIGDYIGEYEINNYTHRHLLEMIPDILTSLGILGTFVGLVWGLKGFNPVSYEAMASSITSLIDGIKVAFVTSIFGISLSMAFSYWLRGDVTRVAESLDNFLDKYYLCAVSPTDATAMNHVLANQKAQLGALEHMGENISDQLAVSMADHMDPVMTQMNHTLENFTEVVTLNQQEMLETVADKVAQSIRKEYFSEFVEMRSQLREANQVQKEYLNYITKAQDQFEQNLKESSKEIMKSVEETQRQNRLSAQELETQQQHLSEFVDYMGQAMDSLRRTNEETVRLLQTMNRQAEAMEQLTKTSVEAAAEAERAMEQAREAAMNAEHPTMYNEIRDLDELTERMDHMIGIMERAQRQQQQQQKKKGLFR